MTRKLLIFTAITMILCCGCTKRKSPETVKNDVPPAIPLHPGAQIPGQQTAQTPILPTDPNAVMAEVNGVKLTMAEANEQIRVRMMTRGQSIPPAQMQQARPVFMLQVVDQFIAKTLLATEADKQKIEVTEEDEKEALDKIRATLPEGVDLEKAMADSRLGKAKMMEDLRDNIRIIKLLEPVTGNDIPVTPEEVSKFREQNKARLKAPEMVEASHILVKVEPGDDEKVKSEKKKAIEDIKKQLDEGADFAEMATKHSDCGSAAKGGSLGTFGRGQMVPAFEKAAFAQEPGVVGPVIESRFGYHIIKVEKRSGGDDMPNERIVELIKQGKREKELTKYLDTLRADAKVVTHPALDSIAERIRMSLPQRGAQPMAAPPQDR